MSDDLSQDIIPVKDATDGYRKTVVHDIKDERRYVFKLPRAELEDRFLRVCDDNMVLKTHSRKQEDKIKKMATKLIRLINDHKKKEQGGQHGRRLDLETEELVEEMQEKIRDLDRQNTLLKEKLVTAKQQLAQHSKSISPCSHRFNQPKNTSKSVTKAHFDDESRENHYMRELRIEISNLKSQLTSADTELEYLTGLLSEREADYEKQILQLKAQVKQTQKHHVDENVELIKLQREMKIAHEKMSSLLEQYTKLKENTRLLKISHDQMVKELDNISNQLKDEQSKSLKLRSELQISAANQHVINELKTECLGLKNENEILKESNLKLINSSFNVDREKYNRKNESGLKMKIAKMEEILQADLKEKEFISEEIFKKKSENERLKEALSEAETVAIRFKEMYEDIKEKSEFLTRNDVDVRNFSDALSALRDQTLETEPTVNENVTNELSNELKILRADHAETVNELAKLRAMLQLQYQINSDYKHEMELVNQKLYGTEQELKQRCAENKQRLDSQISKNEILEKQLSDVARGSVQITHTPALQTQFTQNEDESHVTICFRRLVFTPDGNSKLENSKSTMLTWSFYDFELTATKVVHGVDPDYNCTVVYPTTVDETFLEYLHAESIRVELHQVVGTEYKTLAHGIIRLNVLIETNEERIHAKIPLISIEDSEIVVGNIEFWISISVPVSLAISHYRDRRKASGYVHSNLQSKRNEIESDELAALPHHFNEISIKIIQCRGLKSEHRDVEPSSYLVYRFFDWPDHDTILIPFSESPYFNDHKVYQVVVDQVLYNYLLHSSLLVYAFDDSDPRPDVYLGVASVPLFSLTENTVIHGAFDFKKTDGSSNGTVDLTIKWLRPYTKPQEELLTFKSQPDSVPTPIPRRSRPEISIKTVQKPPIAPRKQQKPQETQESEESEVNPARRAKPEVEYLSDDDDDEEDAVEIDEKISSSDGIDEEVNEFDAESDDDVVTSSKSSKIIAEEKMTVDIFYLILFDGSRIVRDAEIQMLYVEFRFLDFLPEETETPIALPKPKPDQPIVFNFHKEFKMEGPGTGMRRKMLQNILISDDPDDKTLIFTVVSEPENDTAECQDVAHAYINLQTILHEDRDLIEKVVPLFSADAEKTEVGELKISLHILQVLKSITEEIDDFSS